MRVNFDLDAVIQEMAKKALAEAAEDAAKAEAESKAKVAKVEAGAARAKAEVVAKLAAREVSATQRLADAKKREEKPLAQMMSFLREIAHLIPKYTPSEADRVRADSPGMKMTINFYKGDRGQYSAEIEYPILTSTGEVKTTLKEYLPSGTIQQAATDHQWQIEKLRRTLDLPRMSTAGMLEEIKRLRAILEAKGELDELRGE